MRSAPRNIQPAVWDILSTVGDVIDAGVPADLDGVSFAPTLLGQGPGCQEEHEYLYWEYAQGGTQRKAVRMGNWKGVRYGNAGSGVPLQVFDLANDPGETTNVVGQNPSIDAALERLMASRRTYDAQWFRGADEFPTVRNVTLTASGEDLQLAEVPALGDDVLPVLIAGAVAIHIAEGITGELEAERTVFRRGLVRNQIVDGRCIVGVGYNDVEAVRNRSALAVIGGDRDRGCSDIAVGRRAGESAGVRIER